MKGEKPLKRIRVAAWLVLCCLLGGLFSAAGDTRLTDRWLHLSSSGAGPRYFVDAQGAAVTLTGPFLRQDRVYEKSLTQIAENWRAQGANAVRLGVCTVVDGVDRVEECGGYTAEGINLFIDRYVDADVQAVLGSGMYLVLTLSDPPAAKHISAAVEQALSCSLPLWIELVRHYAGEPMIAAFDLWDEPAFGLQDDPEGRELLGKYFVDAVDTLRLYDTEHVLIVSDWNGGRGTAVATQWAGAADQLDSVYHNTAFSIHTGTDILSGSYSYYGAWWTATATEWGACLFFGRVSATEETVDAVAQENLLKLAQAPTCVSVFFDAETGETSLPLWHEGVKETAAQPQDRRFVYEAETAAPATYLIRQKPVGVHQRRNHRRGHHRPVMSLEAQLGQGLYFGTLQYATPHRVLHMLLLSAGSLQTGSFQPGSLQKISFRRSS